MPEPTRSAAAPPTIFLEPVQPLADRVQDIPFAWAVAAGAALVAGVLFGLVLRRRIIRHRGQGGPPRPQERT